MENIFITYKGEGRETLSAPVFQYHNFSHNYTSYYRCFMFKYIFSNSAVQCATHMRSVFLFYFVPSSHILLYNTVYILLILIIRAYFCREDLSVVLFPESIEYFIEDQALSPSYDLAPPLSHQQTRPKKHRTTEKERQLAHRGRGW
jgi:hypothetical protein